MYLGLTQFVLVYKNIRIYILVYEDNLKLQTS